MLGRRLILIVHFTLIYPQFGLAADAATGPVSASESASGEPIVVTTREIAVDYVVNEGALPLSAVDLWYTADEGTTWRPAGADDDRFAPVVFHAPADGVYGLLVTVSNTAGVAGPTPAKATPPQVRVLVDTTSPIVEFDPIQVSATAGQPVLQIRWSAGDDLFSAKPIQIEYQVAGADRWTPVTAEPLANIGRFDWSPPNNLAGLLLLRVSAADQGGHVAVSKSQSIVIPRPAAMDLPVAPATDAEGGTAISGSKRAKERASRLLAEAVSLRDRGAYREAVGRVREAVHLHPGMTEAFVEMGDLLYRLGDTDEALRAFDIALQQQPNLRSALVGAARLHLGAGRYPQADQHLRAILRYNPGDAEILLQLGDVAVYRGDELSARDYYGRALHADATATRVIEDARKRLFIMDENARRLRAGKP